MTLANIRTKIANQQRKKEELTKLNEELLHQAWGQYIEKLIALKNPSAVTNFKHAVLRVIDENTFEISTESVIQQKFIEQERGQLIAHLFVPFNDLAFRHGVAQEGHSYHFCHKA